MEDIVRQENTLEKLERACATLKNRLPMLAVLAIQWLHFTNSREPMRQKLLSQNNKGVFLLIVLRMGWLVVKGVRLAFYLIWLRYQLRNEYALLQKQSFDVIAKTWVFGSRQEKGHGDLYYGDLQKRLQDKNIASLIICGNVRENDFSSFLTTHVSVGPFPKLPDLCLVSWWHVFQMACGQIASAWWLYGISWLQKDPLTRRVFFKASIDCLKPHTTYNGLHYWMGKTLVKLWKPKTVLSLYEGHGWEKCLWSGVKAQDPLCKTAGYQHTIILQRTLALRRPDLSSKWQTTPDLILSNGCFDATILKNSHPPKKTEVIPFGSFHCLNGPEERRPNPKCHTVLVLSDVPSEARLIFEEALQAAALLKDYHFIFRTHPSHSHQGMKKYMEQPLRRLRNIEVSNKIAIGEDIARAAMVFYRGTTSVLYAVLKGLKPMALHRPGLENIDPLFDLRMWRECVQSGRELSSSIARYATLPLSQILADWEVALAHVQSLTMPVEDKSVDLFVRSIAHFEIGCGLE